MKKSIFLKERDFKAFIDKFNDGVEHKYNYIAALRLDACCDFPEFTNLFAKFVGGSLYSNYSVAYYEGSFEVDKSLILIKLPFNENLGVAIINHPYESTKKLADSSGFIFKGRIGIADIYSTKFKKGAVSNAFKAFCNNVSISGNNIYVYVKPNYESCNTIIKSILDSIKYNSIDETKGLLLELKNKALAEAVTFEELFFVVKSVIAFFPNKYDETIVLNWNFNTLREDNISVDYLCGILCDCVTSVYENSARKRPYKYRKIISDIIIHIEKNYATDVKLKTIAEEYHIKPSYLSVLFKNVFDCTFTEYVTDLRMKKACELLKTTDYSINEIYEQVGYSDYYSFIKAFKKNIGVSPTIYRKTII